MGGYIIDLVKNMLKNLIVACAVILFSIILTFGLNTYFKSERGEFFVLEKGQPVPNFSFNNDTLYNYRGQIIIIHFWASWCAPCVVEFPELIALANTRDDVTILAFSSDRNQAMIDRFLDRHKFDIPDNFKIIHDDKQIITKEKFSVFALPESFIVTPDLILDNHIIGAYTGWKNL